MMSMIKRLFVVVGCALLFFTALVVADLAFLRGHTPPTPKESGVAELEEVVLGGTKQWILVRGADRLNPVVLWLHGGPGMPAMYLTHAFQRPLEERFVVVQWDRLGAGKSYEAADAKTLSVSLTLRDTFELTQLLMARFGGRPIYLVGHSWGSYLGLLAVREHPEYYAGFVGTGVLVGPAAEVRHVKRRWLEAAARAAGDSAVLDRLAADGDVTEADLFRYGGELRGATSFWPLLRIGLAAPEYTLGDILNVRKGATMVAERMSYDVEPEPLEWEVGRFDVPIAFFLGRHDYNTPSDVAARFLEISTAPSKNIEWFEGSAHFPFLAEPEHFAAALSIFAAGR
jgi:pimeloyl-ACP methyl ester carboxylesterase